MFRLVSSIVVLFFLLPNISVGADIKSPEVFTKVVKTDDELKIKDHMGHHLYRLFDEINSTIAKLDNQPNLSSEDFQSLYENLTEIRAHLVAVMPKLPRKIKDLELEKRAELFREYQKYLARGILYTVKIEEAIGLKAATESEIKRRNEELVKLVGRFTILIGQAHSRFRD